jgi:4-carboxymuconolactone decarboxylase
MAEKGGRAGATIHQPHARLLSGAIAAEKIGRSGFGSFQRHVEVDMAGELFDKGLEVRSAVLGKEYVQKSLSAADDFSMPLQEYATEACWGMIWTRPGLPRKTRSLLNIAMLTALNRPHELKLHIKSSFNNGVTKEEIREVLLQAACYCGVPAGVDSFRIAREAFAELDAAK